MNPVIRILSYNSFSLLAYWLRRRHSKPPNRSRCKEIGGIVRPAQFSNQRKSKLLPSPIGLCPGEGSHTVAPWLSLSQLFIAILSDFVTEICTAASYSAVSVNFSHQIINGLRSGHVEFSLIFLSLFHAIGSLIGDKLDKTMNPLYSAVICSAAPAVFWQFHLFLSIEKL